MKKAVLIALMAVTVGACGYDVDKHPDLEGCWVIEDEWSGDHEGIACEIEVSTER